MATEVGPIVATLKGDTKNFEQAMQRSNSELLALGAGSVAMGNIATQAFNYLAAGAVNAAGTLHRWAEEAAGAAEKTQILSMKMGISQTTLEGWGAALKRVGLDQDALAGGMKKLSSNLEGLASGNEKSVELFGRLNSGLSQTELASLSTEQAIRVIADKFAGMADGAEKAALSQELLGRAGLQLIPVLNEGSVGLDKAAKDAEKFGLVLTETQRGALLKYDDSLDNLSLALEGFKKQVAAAFAPSLTKTIEMMTSAVSYAKSIFTEFANAAEKLFIRFGAIAAVIEIVGKQIFSLSVLNKEAWQQTLQQVDAIDKWAAAEIKAVDATKNASVEMETSTIKTKEYTVSQKALGEQIVAATQIQINAHQAAKQAAMDRMAAEIELGERQKAYAAEVSKQVFGEIFEAEERRMKDAYAGSSVMIENITTKLKALRDMHSDIQKGLDTNTQAYIDEAMAADAALVAQTKAEVEADQKNEQYQGAFIVRQAQAQQAMKFGWSDVFGSMSQSASFAFGQIRNSFGQAIVGLTQGTTNWAQFWQATQGAMLNSAVQWGIDVVGTFLSKNAAILMSEMTTATTMQGIWASTSQTTIDMFSKLKDGVVTAWDGISKGIGGALSGVGPTLTQFWAETVIPLFTSLGTTIAGFLTTMAGALDVSIFGAPFSIPVWAAVGIVLAGIAALSAFAFGAFAEGGIITKPTMALMGEAGPEAVIPLSKLGQLNGGGQTTVVVELDGRTIAKSVFDHMPSVMRVRGMAA